MKNDLRKGMRFLTGIAAAGTAFTLLSANVLADGLTEPAAGSVDIVAGSTATGGTSALEPLSVTAAGEGEMSQQNGALPAAPAIAIEPDRFTLPPEARVLVAVEGTGGSGCIVYVWEKLEDVWTLKLQTIGYLGKNGMSNHRVMGDKTTPIGVFLLNTPFGQCKPLEGFPANYIQVGKSYVWEDDTNRLVDGSTREGERVGTRAYAGYYDYALDAGFNRGAIPNQGSALFLHCSVSSKTYSSGCVAIPKEQMIEIMKLYGAYGDGACYIAQAPRGTFDQIYDTYGSNCGLSPYGSFS